MTYRRGPIVLPAAVTLPSAPVIGAAHLRDALRVSRAVIHLWRRNYGFPQSHQDGRDFYVLMDPLCAWLQAQGVKVTVR